MNFPTRNRSGHAERGEASLCPSRETLPLRYAQGFGSFAQGDNAVPMVVVKIHYRRCPR